MLAHNSLNDLEVLDALQRVIPSEIASAADQRDALAVQLIDKRRRQILRPWRAETVHYAALYSDLLMTNSSIG